jgi:hypothetical protein
MKAKTLIVAVGMALAANMGFVQAEQKYIGGIYDSDPKTGKTTRSVTIYKDTKTGKTHVYDSDKTGVIQKKPEPKKPPKN